MNQVAALFVRRDSIYKTIPGVDCWDTERDARNWPGGMPGVFHPPCRGWGRLRYFARPAPGELDLGPWAVAQVRRQGGVVEHPAYSRLWPHCDLPRPGAGRDEFGGWTLGIMQSAFGHRADKATWLYIVGVDPAFVPPIPLRLGRAECVVSGWARMKRKDGSRLRRGETGWRPPLDLAEREHTPPALAHWLVDLARRCGASQASVTAAATPRSRMSARS